MKRLTLKYLLNIAFLLLVLIFTACTGKELKEYGGNLALNGGGNPVMIATGALIGGSIYGVGTLIENKNNESNNQIGE